MDPRDLRDHVALVTGGNHGIGAAAARALATRRARVVIWYLRLTDAVDPGIPDEYRRHRARDAELVLTAIRSTVATPSRSKPTSPTAQRPLVSSTSLSLHSAPLTS